MRKPKTVTLTRGWVSAEGATKAEAKANLEKQVDLACSCAALHVEKRFECLIVIAGSAAGYNVKIVHPHDMVNGSQHGSSCTYGFQPFEEVLESARNWAAQNSWSTSVIDDEYFIAQSGLKPNAGKQGDLRRWIEWQRRYNDLIADGRTAAEAHQMASGL